jgi:hypothetical protein
VSAADPTIRQRYLRALPFRRPTIISAWPRKGFLVCAPGLCWLGVEAPTFEVALIAVEQWWDERRSP